MSYEAALLTAVGALSAVAVVLYHSNVALYKTIQKSAEDRRKSEAELYKELLELTSRVLKLLEHKDDPHV